MRPTCRRAFRTSEAKRRDRTGARRAGRSAAPCPRLRGAGAGRWAMPPGTIVRSIIIQSAASLALSALLLFLPAGTLAWPQAWVFLVLFYGCSEAMGVW